MKILHVLCVEKEEETQKHIVECPGMNKVREEYEKPPEYEQSNTKDVKNQVKLVKYFVENMKKRKKLTN